MTVGHFSQLTNNIFEASLIRISDITTVDVDVEVLLYQYIYVLLDVDVLHISMLMYVN